MLLARFLDPGRARGPAAVDDVRRRTVPRRPGPDAVRRPCPQLLVLDEPTNNIDLASAEQLVAALDDYRALLIVTHDEHLLP